MAHNKNIIKIVDDAEKLSKRANEVNIKENPAHVTYVVNRLKDTLIANPELTCLCAPQIGINERIFTIRFKDDIRSFVNPVIAKVEGMHLSRERCPSIIGDNDYIVPRYDMIIAAYQRPTGVIRSDKFESAPAEVFQQMVNLLDGILISDFGLEITPEFDAAPQEERQEVIEAYIKSLESKEKTLDTDIKDDPEAYKVKEAIRFMDAVANGEVTLEKNEQKQEKKDEVKESK